MTDITLTTTTTKRRRAQKAVTVAAETEGLSDLSFLDDDESATQESKKSSAKRTKKTARKIKVDIDEEGYEETKVKKTRKSRQPKPEPVYVIPDVERRETKFRGRLGYACLNTILRNKKPASEAVNVLTLSRIDSIKKNGMGWVKDLGRKNNIHFLRLSSETFSFASHLIYGYSLDIKYGHRLTTHPGQFTQLGSPKPGVIENSVRELEYHCQMLDLMGVGRMHRRHRLVLENDELCYNADGLLPICEELDVPLVFDYHHDSLNPSSIPPAEIIKRTNAIFARRGIRPKQHLSDPRPGAVTIMGRRAHADRCERLPDELEQEGVAIDVDLMIEAKDKEQAVLQLYRIYGLEEVTRTRNARERPC
ncbi:UV-endonuclease UvdE-domain-containing protein [Lentinula raphanica]|nr:UV-endonuclease UvdE-domain-containing protein [Lentinula raphanica]